MRCAAALAPVGAGLSHQNTRVTLTLTLLLQVQMWEAGGSMAARVSDEEAYDAALALVGAGVLSRTPRQVRTARALLTQLDSRQDGCARGCFVVLASRTRRRVVGCYFTAEALRALVRLVRPWVC